MTATLSPFRPILLITAFLLLPVAVGVAAASGDQEASKPVGSCYSVIFLDSGSATAKDAQTAVAEVSAWAAAFPAESVGAHPLEADRMAAIVDVANRAVQVASEASLVVYEATSSGSLDGRFEVEATKGGYSVSTVTVRAPQGFCPTT